MPASAVDQVPAALGVGVPGAGERLGGGGVGQELQQHPLQQSAGPAGAEQAPGHQLADQVLRAADRGQAQVGPERLGEALDEDRTGREVPADADQRAGGDVAGMVVLEHPGPGRLEQLREGSRPSSADAHAERVVGPGLHVHRHRPPGEGGLQGAGHHALVVHRHRHHLGADGVQQVEHRGEGGFLDQHDVAEPHGERGQAIERVHGPVDHAEVAGGERPAVPEPLGQVGEDGVDEVALGQGAAGDPGERRSEIGQEVRVGGAQGEVEGERTGTGVHAAVALRAAAPGLRTDVGAVAAPGLQDAGAAQGLPGLVHRGGADAEGLGQRPHGRQAGARGQLAARHQAADRGGDGTRRGAVDAPRQRAGRHGPRAVHNETVPRLTRL